MNELVEFCGDGRKERRKNRKEHVLVKKYGDKNK